MDGSLSRRTRLVLVLVPVVAFQDVFQLLSLQILRVHPSLFRELGVDGAEVTADDGDRKRDDDDAEDHDNRRENLTERLRGHHVAVANRGHRHEAPPKARGYRVVRRLLVHRLALAGLLVRVRAREPRLGRVARVRSVGRGVDPLARLV